MSSTQHAASPAPAPAPVPEMPEGSDAHLERQEALERVREDGDIFVDLSEELRADREIVLAAVQNVGEALEHASEELRADAEVVVAALRQNPEAIDFASETLFEDRDFLLATAREGFVEPMCSADPELLADRDFVLEAVGDNGQVLECMPNKWRDDREIVLAAVSDCGDALEFASDRLQADREVVLAAVASQESAFLHASRDLKHDLEVVLATLRQGAHMISFVPRDVLDAYPLLRAFDATAEDAREHLKTSRALLAAHAQRWADVALAVEKHQHTIAREIGAALTLPLCHPNGFLDSASRKRSRASMS